MHSVLFVVMVAQQPPPSVDLNTYAVLLQQITTPFELFNTLIGIVLPLAVALITNKAANPNLKAALLFVLSALASVLTTATTALDGITWATLPTAFGHIMIAAIVAHFGFWRKGLGDLLAKQTSSFGIGANVQGSNSQAQPAPGVQQDPEGSSRSRR